MSRGRRVSVGALAAVLVGIGGYGGWQWWQGEGCAVDLPHSEVAGELAAAGEAELADRDLAALLSVDRADAPVRQGLPRVTLLDVPTLAVDGYPMLLGDGSLVVASRGSWPLSADSRGMFGERALGDMVSVIDTSTGRLRWSRVQTPPLAPAVSYRNRMLLLRQAGERPLTAVMVDVSDGGSATCASPDRAGELLEVLDVTAAVTTEGRFALVYTRSDGRVGLSVMSPDDADILVETTVDLPFVPGDLQVGNGLLVTSLMPGTVPDPATDVAARKVDAFSVSDGEHLWSYTVDLDGRRQYTYDLLEVGQHRILVLARSVGPGGELMESRLVALDPGTGQQRWQRRQRVDPGGVAFQSAPQVGVFDDVIVAREAVAERRWLVGYDSNTGDELWRVADPGTVSLHNPSRGAYLAGGGSHGAALIPAGEGLVEVDLSTGRTRTVVEGLMVVAVRSDDHTVAVEFFFDGARMIALYDRR